MSSRVSSLLQKGKRVLQDLELLKVLQSEIRHELSNPLYQDGDGSLGDFVIDWDSPLSKDVVMRKKFESGEELAVSTLLGGETFVEGSVYPKEVDMKVCVKKTRLSAVLQFDCKVLDEGHDIDFRIQNVYYLSSPSNLCSSLYRGPVYRDLDPALQQELKQYLISRGIGIDFANFLLLHLHRKEQNQYIKWLQKLETFVGPS